MPALKSIGQKSEDQVLEHFLEQGYKLLKRNHRIIKTEVDLLFAKGNKLHIVEVKTFREGFPLISNKQLLRLKRVAEHLSLRHRSSVRLHLACVERQKGLEIHWDIGDEV